MSVILFVLLPKLFCWNWQAAAVLQVLWNHCWANISFVMQTVVKSLARLLLALRLESVLCCCEIYLCADRVTAIDRNSVEFLLTCDPWLTRWLRSAATYVIRVQCALDQDSVIRFIKTLRILYIENKTRGWGTYIKACSTHLMRGEYGLVYYQWLISFVINWAVIMLLSVAVSGAGQYYCFTINTIQDSFKSWNQVEPGKEL